MITFVATATSFGPSVYTCSADGSLSSFMGDVTKGFSTTRWQLNAGATVQPYQATTTANIPLYNGVQPRLIQRANPAVGIANDVVLATATGTTAGVWEQLTGNLIAPTGDHGVMEVIVDCDGSGGYLNVDDWTIG